MVQKLAEESIKIQSLKEGPSSPSLEDENALTDSPPHFFSLDRHGDGHPSSIEKNNPSIWNFFLLASFGTYRSLKKIT